MTAKPKGRQGREKAPQTKTICVLGPSFVGKTQIVNRLVNNAFFPQYHATDEVDTYKIYYNRAQTVGSAPDFVQIEILDCFPQDHPLLFTDASINEEAKIMQDQLKYIIENNPNREDDSPLKGQKPIQAYIFVYDSSKVESFRKVLKVIKSVDEFEVSNALGREEEEGSRAMKYVIGTKKDLKAQKRVLEENDMIDLQKYNTDNTISLQEVSALTAYGIHEVFMNLIDEVIGQAAPGAQAQQNQTRQAAQQSESEGRESEDDDEDSDEEEEVKGEAPNSGEQPKEAKYTVAKPQDAFNKMVQKKNRKRDKSADPSDPNKSGLGKTSGSKRGRSQPQGTEEGFTSKGMFQSLMPFLFQKETDTGGKSKTRK